MNRILLLAIAASSGTAAATAAATSSPLTATSEASSSTTGAEATLQVQYGATTTRTLTSTLSPTTVAASPSTSQSKSAKNEKEEGETDDISSTAAATIDNADDSEVDTTHLHTHQNNHHHQQQQDQQHNEQLETQHELFGKSAKSGGKGSIISKTSKMPTEEGTTWAPASAPPSSLPFLTVSPSSLSPSSSSLLPSTTTSSQLPALTWMGVNSCTPTNPCDACTGDCDTDSDCLQIMDNNDSIHDDYLDFPVLEIVSLEQRNSGPTTNSRTMMTMACYKRADGSTDQVPGCRVGGGGDIPGADYCYYKQLVVEDENCDKTDVPTYLPTTSPVAPSTIKPGTMSPFTWSPSLKKTLWPSSSGNEQEQIEAYFIQSRAQSGGDGGAAKTTASTSSEAIDLDDDTSNAPRAKRRNLQGGSSSGSVVYWCASGALSPNYYQLLLEECAYDNNYDASGNNIIARMEQMDQLWSMDNEGYIHSVWDYERCMTVPIYAVDNVQEVPVKIGPCVHDASALSQFYYDNQTLKIVGYDRLCVTFEGGEVAAKGSPMILRPCQETDDKFGWDFVSKQDQDEVLQQPSLAPASSAPVGITPPAVVTDLPRLQYIGRGGCGGESSTPCQSCVGDCDVDDDCSSGLLCFQRAIGDSSQVPGCALGGPGDIPGADYCFDPTLVDDNGETALPSLRWRGAEGCSADRPCPACTGDCDEDEDCEGLYECLKRLVGETTQIPGCAIGGSGDIPGGDYCYDPGASDDGVSGTTSESSTSQNEPLPIPAQATSLEPLTTPSIGAESMHPTIQATPISAPSTLSPGLLMPSIGAEPIHSTIQATPISAPPTLSPGLLMPSIGAEPIHPIIQATPITTPPTLSPEFLTPQLQYLGRNACSVSAQCQPCTGDCDSDDDCSGDFRCFQRAIGDSSQVPGCKVGGLGDIPGGDYCFDPTNVDATPVSSASNSVPTPSIAGSEPIVPVPSISGQSLSPIVAGDSYPTSKPELVPITDMPSSKPTEAPQSKSGKDRKKDSHLKGIHHGLVDSTTAMERRRKHDSTREEREHLNAHQKENETDRNHDSTREEREHLNANHSTREKRVHLNSNQ